MPIAIAITDIAAPAIVERDTASELLDALAGLEITPVDAASDEPSARAWLESLPLPSGWFADADEAQALRRRMQVEQDAQLVRDAVKHLNTTQRGLTAMLGLADPRGDGRPVRRIIAAQQGLSGPARRLLAYVVSHGSMSPNEEAAALNRVGNGGWRNVKRSDIRAELSPSGTRLR